MSKSEIGRLEGLLLYQYTYFQVSKKDLYDSYYIYQNSLYPKTRIELEPQFRINMVISGSFITLLLTRDTRDTSFISGL